MVVEKADREIIELALERIVIQGPLGDGTKIGDEFCR